MAQHQPAYYEWTVRRRHSKGQFCEKQTQSRVVHSKKKKNGSRLASTPEIKRSILATTRKNRKSILTCAKAWKPIALV